MSLSLRRWLPWIFGIAIAATVVFVALRFSEARDFVRLAERANGWWLIAATALQAATYVAQGQVIGCAARARRFALSWTTLYQLSLAKLFVEQAVPTAGLSGTVVLVGLLEKRGMPRPLVAAAVVIDLVSCYAAYVFGLLVALVVTVAHGEASAVIVIACAAFSAVASALAVVALAIAGRAPGPIARKLARFRPIAKALGFLQEADGRLTRTPRVVIEAALWQLAILVLDAATIWGLIRAVGHTAAPAGVFASFMISTVFRIVGVLPGGLGAFEASSVVTLRMLGMPLAVALAATVLFRGLSFWLPMIPGLWCARRLTKE